jgi:hypothetical protein
MTIPERVRDFLVDHRPDCFCDDCIQERLSLKRRQEVAPVTKTLGLTPGFIRGAGLCVSCTRTRTKLGIQAV